MDLLNRIFGECRTYSDKTFTHNHAYAQLIIPLQGTLFLETTHQHLQAGEAHLLFLPPHCRHAFFANDTNRFLVLDVPEDFVSKQDTPARQDGLLHPFDERWQALRYLMLSEVENKADENQNLIDLFFYAQKLLLQNRYPRSLDYIHRHFDRPLELRQLAALEGYNLTYYCNWFKKLTGSTPQRYIQQLRLDKAKILLKTTDLTILQIAQQVGYEHHASLTRLFQQRDQLTPTAYRQQNRI